HGVAERCDALFAPDQAQPLKELPRLVGVLRRAAYAVAVPVVHRAEPLTPGGQRDRPEVGRNISLVHALEVSKVPRETEDHRDVAEHEAIVPVPAEAEEAVPR